MSEDASPPPRLAPARGDTPAMVAIGAITGVLYLLMAYQAPGVLVGLLILATPAWIRAVIAISRERAAGTRIHGLWVVSIFFSSLGVVFVASLAFGLLFGITCSTVAVGIGMSGKPLMVSIVCGLIPGLLAAGYILRDLWSRKATHAAERPHISGNDSEPLP